MGADVRHHESLNNVTPADAYFGRDTAIIERRRKIKELTIQNRRLKHQRQAANLIYSPSELIGPFERWSSNSVDAVLRLIWFLCLEIG